MAESTGISWCDATFNPWVGCEKVSPGCANCYAETLVTGSGPRQMNRPGTWGADGVRERTSESNWKKPIRWNKLAGIGKGPGGDPIDHRPRVFCASLADVFEPRLELDEHRWDLFKLIERTPNLDWLILTKRPEYARDWLDVQDLLTEGAIPNVWLGVSIENARHTFRAEVLRQIPATVRFLSCEPLLGSLYPPGKWVTLDGGYIEMPGVEKPPLPESGVRAPLALTGIDWVIVGGESGGRNARPMHPEWAREIRDHVLTAGNQALDEAFAYGAPDDVIAEGIRDEMSGRDRPAFHFKQWGSFAPQGIVSGKYDTDDHPPVKVVDRGDGTLTWRMHYYGSGSKAGGKILDGVEWCEFPERAGALVPA